MEEWAKRVRTKFHVGSSLAGASPEQKLKTMVENTRCLQSEELEEFEKQIKEFSKDEYDEKTSTSNNGSCDYNGVFCSVVGSGERVRSGSEEG